MPVLPNIYDFIGETTLEEYIALSDSAIAYIGMDTLNMHIAASQNKPIFAIEAGVINGWEKYIKNENFVGMSTFGESGPYKDLYKHFKITDDNLIEKIIKNL